MALRTKRFWQKEERSNFTSSLLNHWTELSVVYLVQKNLSIVPDPIKDTCFTEAYSGRSMT